MMDISVIIVNYNTSQEIKNCIDSVLRQKDIIFEIIVVDNASQDDSLNVLRSYGDQIILISSEKNLGFGCANNLAFSKAQGKIIYCLNPDAWLEDSQALKRIEDYFKSHLKCGLLATAILNEASNKPTLPRYHYPGEKRNSHVFQNLPGKIAWVLGASIAFPREVFAHLQGFDPQLFLYAEDIDISLRVRQAGYEIHYLDSVVVRHVGGASEKHTQNYAKTVKKQLALHYFYRKHYSSLAARRLVAFEKYRAGWRCFFYKILLSFKEKPLWQSRYQHYLAVKETSQDFLLKNKKI